jgi:hypothetical protein
MQAYDSENYTPPMPISQTRISSDIPGIGKVAKIEVTMILDTGADMSIIPKTIIKQLENSIGQKLPYDFGNVEDYNGAQFREKIYTLSICCNIDEFQTMDTLQILAIDGSEGILGRDVLNKYSICLDGASLAWRNNYGKR